MNYIERMLTLQDLVNRISKGTTGNKSQLARQLHMTETSLRRRLEELKDMGAEIVFDQKANTYYINNEFTIHVEVKVNNERQ